MTRTRHHWTVAVAAALAALAVVAIPVWLIQPFAPQTPEAVQWSWRLRQVARPLTLGALLLTLATALTLWPVRPRRRWASAGWGTALVLLLGATAGAAWFARQNHFEWMFRPFPDPRFVAADAAADVPADEPVLGVANGEAALAFPITRIGYHHLVNATLGNVPIVATY